ncbi:MAG: hypothetical protein N3A59_04950 [Thermodesulfovibrionales bacterium]|nr:hypothetical protein [Thermodesulfovibrionales bacterium]
MNELGKIEKPSVDSFSQKRKIYCVPNVVPFSDLPEEYTNLANKYWEDVNKQLNKLNVIWQVKKIFCENIFVEGKEALDILEKTHKKVFEIIYSKIQEGASLIPLDNKDLLGIFVDWRNCLSVVRTPEVFKEVYHFYSLALDKRLNYIKETIEKNLSSDEASLLVMEDEMRAKIQFNPDIEVFLVRPPSYDDVIKWLRDNLR